MVCASELKINLLFIKIINLTVKITYFGNVFIQTWNPVSLSDESQSLIFVICESAFFFFFGGGGGGGC